jgi:hypothetical protein
VLVRRNRGEDPAAIASLSPGYFERILWVDEDRMVAGYSTGEVSAVDLLGIDGTQATVGDGRLIGLMRPAAVSAVLGEDLPSRVKRGDLEIVTVTANGEIAGPGIKIVVHNPGPDDITTTIPCGFIFEPDDPTDQRLMVVQPVTAVIPTGDEATLTVYVVCVDSSKEPPDDGATYAPGSMQSGDLLKLAQCACGENLAGSLNPFEGMGVMIAGWMISEGRSFAELQAQDSEGATSGAFGEAASEAAAGMLEKFEASSTGWFDRCSIPMP